MAELERIYVVPLRRAYETPRTKRSRKAVKILRSFISRHMKAEEMDVAISEGVNSLIWKRGIQKPPRKIKVRAVKNGEKVVVSLLDEKVKAGEAKEPKPKKEEAKPAEKPKEKEKAEPAKETPPEKKEGKTEPEPAKEEPKKKDDAKEPREGEKEPQKPAEKPKEKEKAEPAKETPPEKKE
jgi:large subunit ribosomal protein L31e